MVLQLCDYTIIIFFSSKYTVVMLCKCIYLYEYNNLKQLLVCIYIYMFMRHVERRCVVIFFLCIYFFLMIINCCVCKSLLLMAPKYHKFSLLIFFLYFFRLNYKVSKMLNNKKKVIYSLLKYV